MNKKLKQAIDLIKAGEDAKAHDCLVNILKADPTNDTAWVWMATVVEKHLQRKCLEEALKHNPRNKVAQRALQRMTPQTKLGSPSRPAYTRSRERPGCVTIYASLLGITASLIALFGIIAGIAMISGRYGSGAVGLVIIVVAGVMAGLEFLLARGLWQQKNWARITVIVLQSLSVLSNLLSVCGTLGVSSYSSYGHRTDPTAVICGAIGGLAIGGYIIYWFASHGEYFS